jgi:hypothetical protein
MATWVNIVLALPKPVNPIHERFPVCQNINRLLRVEGWLDKRSTCVSRLVVWSAPCGQQHSVRPVVEAAAPVQWLQPVCPNRHLVSPPLQAKRQAATNSKQISLSRFHAREWVRVPVLIGCTPCDWLCADGFACLHVFRRRQRPRGCLPW